jgi:hypothetical protein
MSTPVIGTVTPVQSQSPEAAVVSRRMDFSRLFSTHATASLATSSLATLTGSASTATATATADPTVGAWTQLLERAEKEEVRKSEAVAGRAAAEEALQRGTLEELRGLLRELDATAWMYE